MVYKNKSFCSNSDQCAVRWCEYWIDFDHDTNEAIILLNYKTDQCGFQPIQGSTDADQHKV